MGLDEIQHAGVGGPGGQGMHSVVGPDRAQLQGLGRHHVGSNFFWYLKDPQATDAGIADGGGSIPHRKSRPCRLAGHSERVTNTSPSSFQPPGSPYPSGQAGLDLHARLGTSRHHRRRARRVALQPAIDVVVEVLLGPQHPGESLAHDSNLVRRGVGWGKRSVELPCLGLTIPHHPAPRAVQAQSLRGQAEADHGQPSPGHCDAVVQGAFGAGPVRVDSFGAVHHVISYPALGVGGRVLHPEEPGAVGLVVAHERTRSWHGAWRVAR